MSGFWTLERLTDALGDDVLGARPLGTTPVRAIATDTRTLEAGDAFLALRGERYDAHDFLAEAAARGVRALIVEDARPAAQLGVPVYLVSDTLRALWRLAAYRRAAWSGAGKPIIAVAGSNGKSTTKELVRAALASTFAVDATSGNLNNHIGVPLTLLALRDDADLAIVEVGTNHPGEVAALGGLVQPTVAIVTSIGEEHLEGLGDLAGVLREEVSICKGAAVAITPAAQPEVADAARALAVDDDGFGSLTLGGTLLRLPVPGTHTMRNAMLAVAAAEICGIPREVAAQGLRGVTPLPMRSAWHRIGALTVINDAYNANPASMREAIALIDALRTSRQRVLVLGSMLELGAQSDAYHREIAQRALASSAGVVAGVGEFARILQEMPPGNGHVLHAATAEELWPVLKSRLAPDAVLLLKASRGVRLERLVPLIERWAAPATA
jgi:UDP-N-acetylmuramoyl-tripeptide--D-alanyl-D-alanine ligase